MRKYQLTLKLSVFDGTRTEEEGRDLNVYVDGNDIFGVLYDGFRILTRDITKAGIFPSSSVVKQSEWRQQDAPGEELVYEESFI